MVYNLQRKGRLDHLGIVIGKFESISLKYSYYSFDQYAFCLENSYFFQFLEQLKDNFNQIFKHLDSTYSEVRKKKEIELKSYKFIFLPICNNDNNIISLPYSFIGMSILSENDL